MKVLLLYVVSLVAFSGLIAQEKKIQLEWLDNQIIGENGSYTEVPLAKNFGYGFNESGCFQFSLSWKSKGFTYNKEDIDNVIYENINVDKLINLDKSKLPNKFEFSVKRTLARGISYESLTFTPVVKDGSTYKKVVSFNLTGNQTTVNSSNTSSKVLRSNDVSSSVLATGEWFKFKVDTTGVYKVTPQFLSSIGMNLNDVDANTIKIYGNGGAALPLPNDENEIFDVPENPIKIVGFEDGVFSGDDYILFYGRGTKGYVMENRSHVNPYDDDAYYYVTFGGNPSSKITSMSEPDEAPSQVFDTYDYYTFYEEDLNNLGRLGRIWHGDKFDGLVNSRQYELSFPELSVGTSVDVQVVFSAIYGQSPQLEINVDDQTGEKASTTLNFGSLDLDNKAYKNVSSVVPVQTGLTSISGDKLFVNLNYNRGADVSSEGYLDYISLSAECLLKGNGNQFGFSNSQTSLSGGSVGGFSISNASNIMSVWDVTNPYNISEKVNENEASEIELVFNRGSLKTYVAIDEGDLYEPTEVSDSRVNNQDLKGTVFQTSSSQFQDIDYLILTNKDFLVPAQKLANFRTQNDGFNVKVIDIESVYNEFSTGKQDIGAIRNFIKYIYDNGTLSADVGGTLAVDNRLKYVCIIGDGSYDYKDRIENNTNHVPLYHAIESSSLANSYATDDFYCFMDLEEGGNPDIDKMDISIGRMVVRNSAEANTMVDKVINYYDEVAYGDWRNSMLFLSDDVDQDSDARIQDKIIEISDKLESQVERVNVKRILTDSYVQQTTSGGERYDLARADFENAFDIGMSYINYFGHGGEDGITGEFVFSSESAQNLTNEERLPVFVTLTCELTRFDNPNRLTAGEFLYWNPIGGAVALISTTRNLFLFTGLDLNDSLSESLFDENNLAIPIGDAIRLAKNSLSGGNKRTVFCIGDPAIIMAVPKPEVELTEVNEAPLSQWEDSGDSLKALDRVTLKGKVVNGVGGADLSSYTGEVTITIFDKDVQRNTLVNDGIGESVSFTESGSLVYKGLASVSNGTFSSEFVLPKSVKLEEGEGKISFYVENGQSLDDQSGSESINIGGLNTDAVADVTPPVINLFLNDETFFSGQVVGASPNIFVKLADESGINTAGGVGHDIIAILDGDEANPIVLNEYYNTNLDDFTSGELTYKLNNLEQGEHTLSLRASDTYNNSSSEEITFLVNEFDDFSLSNVLNYPNPFVNYTEFWFSHTGISNDTLEVSVQVLTVTGKIVTTKFATLSGESTYRPAITWDGKDDFGNKIGKGVYVYKITAKSTLTNKTTSKFQKLVVL